MSTSQIEEQACICLEMNLKPISRRLTSTPSMATKDELNSNIDDKYAVMHWSDAHKMCISDGEPVLIVCTNNNDNRGGDDNSSAAIVCPVRISTSSSTLLSAKKGTTPQSSKKKSSTQCKVTAGDIILSPNSIHDYLLQGKSTNDNNGVQTKPTNTQSSGTYPSVPSATANNNTTQYTSPSKSSFSFSKGGGGESFTSPTPPTSSRYTSPSGSKFSFTKSGSGGNTSHTKPTTPSTQRIASTKVMVIPLANLSSEQQFKLCPNAQTVQIYPISTADSSATDASSFISSSKIIQTLVISKYKNKYVQPTSLSDDETVSSRNLQSKYETISISFRGQIEHFYVVNAVQTAESQDKSNQKGEDLTTIFDQLDISGGTSNLSDSDSALKSIQQYLRQRENAKCSDIVYKITSQTKIDIVSSLNERHSTSSKSAPTTGQADKPTASKKQQVMCAGLDSTLVRVKDALLPPLLHPNLFPADGPLRPPKGALLYGPAGVGKSLLAAQIANDLSCIPDMMNVHVRLVQCADILSSTAIVGEAEQILTGIFQEAEKRDGGSLIILDDVHLICPRRGGMGGSGSLGVDQLAGTLLALLDGIGSSSSQSNNIKSSEGGLVVLAITTDPSLLDPALRRPGRLDVEVEVPVPDDNARAEILRFHISQLMTAQQVDEIDITALAKIAKGFTGADCKLAVKEAVRNYLSCTQQIDGKCDQKKQTDSLIPIQYTDLEHAIRITKPSAIKSVAVEVPKVPWSAIGGMDDVKALLKESIELPLTHPHLFEMMRVPPPKGILLYGPPGCSKTLMARAIATEGNMNFLAVKGPELLSKWLGESERALASLFRRARLASPSVIFFDEMDAIASKRGGGGGGGDRLLSQLLTELDGVTSGGNSSTSDGRKGRVIVVGATNRPDVLDPALTRPGRMDRMIHVGLPDEKGRQGIFKIGLSGKDCHDDVDVSLCSYVKLHEYSSFI